MATEYTETFDDLLKDTLVDLPGAIRSLAKRELRLTLREFFEKSYAWVTTIEGIDVPAGDVGIQLNDADVNTEVIGLLGIGYDGKGLVPMGGKPNQSQESENPQFYFVGSNPDEIKVFPYLVTPSTGLLTATVAVMPSFDTELLPRQITLKYYDAIMDGFLARMYGHPNKPYSAPMVAVQKRHNFVRMMGYYAAQRKQGYNTSQVWRFPSTTWSPRTRRL